jgi:hypothetical protein
VVPRPLRRIEQFGCGEPIEFDTKRVFELVLDEGRRRLKGERPGLVGIVPDTGRFAAAFVVSMPRLRSGEPAHLHVEQWIGGRLVGGSSYEFRRAARRGRTS